MKNAFTLSIIDYMHQQVRKQDSEISKNFQVTKNLRLRNKIVGFLRLLMEFFSISQLASCSLDAGTKIYAVRVDCVAKEASDFSMVMSMANKKDRQEEGGEEDVSAQTLEEKKKKIRKVHTQSSF